jgi:hypothetical protein
MSKPAADNVAGPVEEPSAGERATEQANAYGSIFTSHTLDLGNGQAIEIPPHPSLRMLPDDVLEEYEELLWTVNNKYDRQPDIYHPEQTLTNGSVVPASTQKGALIVPYQINGERVRPAHSIKVVQIVLGQQQYDKLRKAGKSAADVWKFWDEQSLAVARQETFRPVSNGRTGGLA